MLVILQFLRSDAQERSHWSQGVGRAVFFLAAPGEPVFLLLPASRGRTHSLACGPLLSSKPAGAS